MKKGLPGDTIKRLEDIVGERHVLKTADTLEKYSRDETIGLQAWPDVAVRARSADEVPRCSGSRKNWRSPSPLGGSELP